MSDAKRKIFVFCSGQSDPNWYHIVALAEDGHCIAGHVCSHPSWVQHDMGFTSDWKHEHYDAHFGAGNWELVWLDDPKSNEELLKAIELNKAIGEAAKNQPEVNIEFVDSTQGAQAMTAQEQKSIESLTQLVRDLRTENNRFREDVKAQADTIKAQVDRKFVPVTLEQNIVQQAQAAVTEAINKALTGYDSPLTKLTKAVVESHSTELREIINDSFSQVIRTEEFKASIVSGFSHKVARTIISNNDGLFDRVSNELKQDHIFKSKMALAVANVVEECLKGRS